MNNSYYNKKYDREDNFHQVQSMVSMFPLEIGATDRMTGQNIIATESLALTSLMKKESALCIA